MSLLLSWKIVFCCVNFYCHIFKIMKKCDLKVHDFFLIIITLNSHESKLTWKLVPIKVLKILHIHLFILDIANLFVKEMGDPENTGWSYSRVWPWDGTNNLGIKLLLKIFGQYTGEPEYKSPVWPCEEWGYLVNMKISVYEKRGSNIAVKCER